MKVFRQITANDEQIKPFHFKRELSMEAYLIENEGILDIDETYQDVEIIADELTLKQGRRSQGTDGRIDLLVTYAQEYFGIIELKLGMLEQIHLDQLEDYLRSKDRIIEEYPSILETPKWIGVLAGSSIDPTLATKIANGHTTVEGIPIAALTIQRFRSKRGDIFVTTDTFFKNNTSSKDLSKYLFNNATYGKGRLVLAVIKHFISENPQTTYAQLEQKFPKSCQATKAGVFVTEEEARTIAAKRPRHFLNPDDLIELSNATIAVSNQWGIGNIDEFIKAARSLGFVITNS